MSQLERLLQTRLADLPVLTVFGAKSDPYGWQELSGRTFRNVTAVRLADGHRFPFNDDPDRYATAISEWWQERVASGKGDRHE
jgi:hypothetical protein